jgi:hypothetical protein
MTNLSPVAQAVLDAAINAAESLDAEAIAAAVLRAAADQVVPETNSMFISPAELQQEKTRDQLLAIADELEAQ